VTADVDAALARRVLPLIDLTSLTGEEDEQQTVALCRQARTPAGDVAAVCVYPRWAAVAARELAGTPVAVAVVANFPQGDANPARAREEAAQAIADGADEVDVVLPYQAWSAGDEAGALAVVESARAAVPSPNRLKVILETGRLQRPDVIRTAAAAAIDAGADFVKTSTGKLQPGATPDAARAMLRRRAHARAGGRVPRARRRAARPRVGRSGDLPLRRVRPARRRARHPRRAPRGNGRRWVLSGTSSPRS
jgi:deoxyribose-phosphate aldolase